MIRYVYWIKKWPRRCWTHPEARPKRRHLLSKTSVAPQRVLREALKEAVDRFNNELMHDEERQLLLERIRRIRRQLGLA